MGSLDLAGRSILVVEDEPLICLDLTERLQEAGAIVAAPDQAGTFFATNSSRKPASHGSRPRSSICAKLTPSTPGAPALARARP